MGILFCSLGQYPYMFSTRNIWSRLFLGLSSRCARRSSDRPLYFEDEHHRHSIVAMFGGYFVERVIAIQDVIALDLGQQDSVAFGPILDLDSEVGEILISVSGSTMPMDQGLRGSFRNQ